MAQPFKQVPKAKLMAFALKKNGKLVFESLWVKDYTGQRYKKSNQ